MCRVIYSHIAATMASRRSLFLWAIFAAIFFYQVTASVSKEDSVSIGELTPGEIEDKLQVQFTIFLLISSALSMPLRYSLMYPRYPDHPQDVAC